MLSVIQHPQTVKRGVLQSQLRISDIYSIYPWNGVSDAAIDFYIRSACASFVHYREVFEKCTVWKLIYFWDVMKSPL